jgi:hypothetical protein
VQRILPKAFGVAVVLICLGLVSPALAQDLSNPLLLAPPPPPPPPPKLEIPKIPKLGEISPPPRVPLPQRGSFNDRVSRCLDEGSAMGLGPNQRSAYSGICANR